MKLSISSKLRMSYLALAVLFIVSSLFVYRSVDGLQTQTHSLLRFDLPTVDASRQLGQSLQTTVSELRGHMLLVGSEEQVEASKAKVLQHIDHVDIQLVSLEGLLPEQTYLAVSERWASIKATANKILEIAQTHDNLPAHALFINEAAPIARSLLTKYRGLSTTKLVERREVSANAYLNSMPMPTILLLMHFLLSEIIFSTVTKITSISTTTF